MRTRTLVLIAVAAQTWLGGLASAPGALPRAAYAAPPALSPAKKAEAKKLFDQGAALYEEGAYEDALEKFVASHEISGHPLIFESIANAHERLGRMQEARDALARWREAAPANEHATLDQRLANLDSRIERQQQEEAEAKAETDRLAAERKAEEERLAAERKAEAEGPSTLLVAGLVTTGVGVAMVGTGIVLGLVAAGERPDEAAACRDGGGGRLCLAPERDAIESSSSLALVADVLWIGGAVVGAAGLTLVIVDQIEPSDDAAAPPAARKPHGFRAELVPALTPGLLGGSMQGVF